MSTSILLGNVKGPQGETGATGATGAQGEAATITVGSTTTSAYGTTARVTNSGTTSDAVFDFVIPQGAPGETVTDMADLTLSTITEPSTTFPVPAIGETGSVIFGKITKWFSDMYALVVGKQDAVSSETYSGTTSGYGILQIATGTSRIAVYVVSNEGHICLPFISGGHTFIKVVDRVTMEKVANTAVTGTAYYLL